MSEQRFLVTARKYRPQIFSDLVAQEHVSETLKNAIRLDRLAHAYLFSGPRGVGKTTAARILAKAINCTAPPEERGDGAEPCRQCESCRSFEEGRSLNIIEIDAASNNGVDHIRDLRDTVRIPPQGSKRKVYIIDEVHMLSAAAFNAFLKTLEEPPPYVLFIFATTEPHKVLPTILSRCQRFDFRRITVEETIGRLQQVCEAERILADDASLMLIARKGDGALRDALSAFDQAVSLCGTNIRYADLAQALGVVDVDLYFETTRYIAESNNAATLLLVDRLMRAGYDPQEYLVGLSEHLRNLLTARALGNPDLIEATEAMRRRYLEEAGTFSEADLLRLLLLASEAEEGLRNSSHPRLRLETALLKMAGVPHAADLKEILRKLSTLEGQGGLATTLPTQHAAPVTREPAPRPATVHPLRSETVEEPPAEPYAPRPKQTPQPDPAPAPATTTAAPKLFQTPALPRKNGGTPPSSAMVVNGPSAVVQSSPLTLVTPSEQPSELLKVIANWDGYIKAVTDEKIHIGSVLKFARPIALTSGTLLIAVRNNLEERVLRMGNEVLIDLLPDSCRECVRKIEVEIREELFEQAAQETPSEVDPYEYFKRKRQESPVIKAIFDQFDGQLIW